MAVPKRSKLQEVYIGPRTMTFLCFAEVFEQTLCDAESPGHESTTAPPAPPGPDAPPRRPTGCPDSL